MFVLAWANLFNLDVLLLARFVYRLFIGGFSLTPLFTARLLMLLLEVAIPALTWWQLKSLKKESIKSIDLEQEIKGGGGGDGGMGNSLKFQRVSSASSHSSLLSL